MTLLRAPIALCPALAAIALLLGSGCATATRLGMTRPEGCDRLGPVGGEGKAKTLDDAAERARDSLLANGVRRGATYVELVYETHDQPGPFHSLTRAQAGGVAWRCPDGSN